MLNLLEGGVRVGSVGVFGSGGYSDSGEKSDRSSNVKAGGGGRSEVAKFSRHKAETAAAWPGVVNLPDPVRRLVTGVARSLKKSDFDFDDDGVIFLKIRVRVRVLSLSLNLGEKM